MNRRIHTPAGLLDQLAIENPDEIDIEAIAQFCGATVVYEHLQGCEARIVGNGERAIITVNQASSEARRRFSAAHELGHWIRDRGQTAFGCTEVDLQLGSKQAGKDRERRANRFAAELLLPESLFGQESRLQEPSFSQISSLASRYRTSLTATAIRLVELSTFPLMLVSSGRRGKRQWFVRSPELPGNWWPREHTGTDTVAWDLLTSSDPHGTAHVPMTQWIAMENPQLMTLVEDSLRVNGEVLSLLYWCDAAAVIALTDLDADED